MSMTRSGLTEVGRTPSSARDPLVALACFVLLCFLAGCGSVGEPLYPALNIPMPVVDLSAVERGDKIDINFTISPKTTEGLLLKDIGSVELRLGPNAANEFRADSWSASAKRLDVPLPAQSGAVHFEAPVQEFIGKEVLVAVRIGNPRGRMSAWSNFVILGVEQPLPKPANLRADAVAQGVRLTWLAPNQKSFRIYRKAGEEKDPSLLASSDKPEFVDATTEYGKTYDYYVQAFHEKTESDVLGPQSIAPKDIFPPAVPTGLNVSAGVGAIELSWDRNTESDFKAYQVFRSDGDGPFVKIAEGLEGPSYSDRKVESGKHYRYRISAVDQTGNPSEQSPPVEAIAP
ncbi:MAG TPA: hypothetical protein VIX89_06245 [Bryobacteraceae bacterium]